MRKLILAVGAAALTVPAYAAASDHPPKDHPNKGQGQSHRCRVHSVGFNARGTLISANLTQTAGADTAQAGDDRWSGDLSVHVTRLNHHAAAADRTFTVTNARLRLGVPDRDASGKVDATDLRAGDLIKVKGKVTRLNRKCDQTGFTPTGTVRRIEARAPHTTS